MAHAREKRTRKMTYVEMKDVSKYYQMGENVVTANDKITFGIKKGEFVVIVGPSGAGKSTVLNILGGMDSASEGKIMVDGQDIAQYNAKQLTKYRRTDVGFVFQFYNLVPNLTAKENVELVATNCAKCIRRRNCFNSSWIKSQIRQFSSAIIWWGTATCRYSTCTC